jgi:DNA-binding CsgD family transcriptional regulator
MARVEAEARNAQAEGLLERDREVAALEHAIGEATDGCGRLLLIEGPAGIGKSRLLAEARDRAGNRMTVLAARCSELERDFSFGAVRQLLEAVVLEPGRRDDLLAGAAAPAASVLESAGGDGAAEGSFAVLHGLYWATLNLAEERPVLLALDDLQWCDRPSLRFLAYLAHRLEGVPVLVAATLRSTDPGADQALVAEIAGDPLSEAVRPGPLGEAAVAELVRARLGADPDPRFRAACRDATGGNPLLLQQLLIALAQDGVLPTSAAAAAVDDIGPGAVSRTVLLRLSRLPDLALAVARAVAVLGESSGLATVAALTDLDETAVARAAGELGRADILLPDLPLGFVHPLVREAVYGDVPGGERQLLHARAAEVLHETHASEEELAAQLLYAPRRGDPASVDVLRSAARRATRRGGPDSAVAYLQRALDEPPRPELRGEVLFELGMAESEMSAPAAAEHLRGAYDRLDDPATRAIAAFALTQALLFTGHADEGGALAQRAAAELPAELADERQAIEAIEVIAVFFGRHDAEALRRLAGYREAREGDGPGAKVLTAATAYAWAAGGGPAGTAEALALDAVAGRERFIAGSGMLWSAALLALFLADSPRMPEVLEVAREEGYRYGSVFATASVEVWGGTHLLRTGDLEEAGEALRLGRQLQDTWGSDSTGSSWSRGLLGMHAFVRGDHEAARAALGEAPLPQDESDGANLWRRTHAELLLAAGRAEKALEVAELMGRSAAHVVHPEWKPWQSLKARALRMLDRGDEALVAMGSELDLARRCGAPSTIGRCLRELGELEGSIERLTEAVDILAGASARLEYARALAALGGALRRARRPTEAREPLRQALELASTCGADGMIEHVRSELYASGARPRRQALAGVESLTPSERRVANLAASGRTNRDIAQELYVTPKTIEVHLSNAYRKLGVPSRRELAAALSAS